MAEDYVLQTKVTADSTQFDATLKKAGKSLTAFSTEIQSVTKLLGTLFVGQKIVKFAKTSIDSIEKERKELNLLNTTLKTTGATAWTTQQQLADMAKAFESESNYTSEQIQRAQTVMLGFKTVTGDVFNSAMQNVLDMSEVMGMDLVSAVQTVGKALDDPVKGLGSLQRQGFAFTESQKAMLEEMVKTGRQAEAQKIILDELATTYGGAAKAGQNAFQQLNVAVGNLQKVIGENLAPVIESIATDITELINQFNSLDKGTQTFILTAGSLFTTLPFVVKGINALKIALASLQASVPVLLAITAGIAGISAVVGVVVKKLNGFSELTKEITKITSTTKNYLDTYSEGNEEKKLDEKATKELIKLYPDLNGKISAYTTSVEDARNAVNDLVNQKLIDAESSGIKDYIQKLNEIEKLNEKVIKLTSHKNELDESMAKEILNVSIPAIQKLADAERNSINERLKAIGKLLTLEGTIVEIPIELTPAENLEATKKSWQEALKEVLKVEGGFSTGREAVNIYLSEMEEALKKDKRISEALGEKFDISSALKSQQEQISKVIADLLQQTDIDKPFDIEELSKESTALGSLAKAYKQMGEVISSTNQTVSEENTEWADKLLEQEISILEKRRDNEIEWAKNAKKSEEEIYAIRADYVEKINELQVKQLNSQRDAEIKKVENSKQSVESQKKIIAQINEYYDKQIDLMIEATEKFTKKSGGFLEEWSKQYQSLAGNWTQTFVDMANTATSAMGEMFETIGQGLVDNSVGYEDFASIAIEALAEVLEGLSAQLSALTAVNIATYNYGQASVAAAGAAAALVASGTLKAVANNLKQTATVAKEASDSIDDFIERLQNIKETRFTTIGTFSQGIIEYSAEVTNAVKNMNEAYEEYVKLKNKYGNLNEFWSDKAGVKDAYQNYLSWVKNVTEANIDLSNALKDLVQNSKDVVDENSAITASYKELYSSLTKVSELKSQLSTSDDLKYILLKSGLVTGDITETIRFQYEKYSSYLETLKNNIKAQVQELENSVYESMLSVGKDIGETFISSIVDGATETDFMSSIREYIKKQMIQLVILTDDFSDRISNIGVNLLSAITTGDSATKVSSLSLIKTELNSLYTEMTAKANDVEDILTSVFGAITEEVEETSDALEETSDALEELSEEATTIGDTLMQNILDGATESDFLSSMKSYIKESVLQIAIYSSSLTDSITSIGEQLAQAVLSGNESQINSLKTQLSSLYRTTATQVEGVLSIIDEVFPETAETVSDAVDEIEESLTSFENAMESFNESVKDIGGDIASNLVNGITNGLSQSDFLSNMKDWLKKLLVQSVVYTETMKTEIEEIGKRISEGITTGFTDTSLHEIRRDLSYIFESASSKMSNIDSILNSVFDGYATGTNSALKGLHIVGEAGPELVDFKGGERVYNNADTMKMLSVSGEKGNTFNVTFNNLQDTSAYTMMSQLRDYNRQLAINGVL